jgi:diaminopimelate epimerase
LSCGSGACAAVIYGIRLGLLDSQVRVDFEQGNVLIEYTKGAHVFLTGPAEFVYEGQVEI